jgi:hypothetical protein
MEALNPSIQFPSSTIIFLLLFTKSIYIFHHSKNPVGLLLYTSTPGLLKQSPIPSISTSDSISKSAPSAIENQTLLNKIRKLYTFVHPPHPLTTDKVDTICQHRLASRSAQRRLKAALMVDCTARPSIPRGR